ncbi:hypothetical protein [Klebsiella michiganensis]|uniref:hypothetical protein n=1 Tax=Klebsiella michiganensis TaxID=1134687 RepID=UPI001E54465F|nr:hypothetical protein [Klebsiella michiganensis]MCD6620981.1 hypothetical protein [Klebsiella michiganensis]
MTNNQLIGERLSNSDLEDLICELEAAGFYRRQLICLVELQERRKADSEPVAWTEKCEITNMQATGLYLRGFPDNSHGRDIPLYRHAQQPVVPDDLLDALQKVARIRLDLNDFDGDRRGIADCLSDAEEELIEVVNRCAAMLAAAPQEVPDGK